MKLLIFLATSCIARSFLRIRSLEVYLPGQLIRYLC